MRLKLLLSLAVVLALSCQENSTKVQENVSTNELVSSSLTKDEHKTEFKNLVMMVEKVFVKESDNKMRVKMISKFFLKSKLPQKDKNDILNKTMVKFDLSTEDRKEITLSLSRLKRMELKK